MHCGPPRFALSPYTTLFRSGTVTFAGSGPYNLLQVATAGTTLTIGAGVVVRGQSGTVGYNSNWGGPKNVRVDNRPPIKADVAGATIARKSTGGINHGLEHPR